MTTSWRWGGWTKDLTGKAARIEWPEGGGWIYEIQDQNAQFSHVFVPNMAVWADAIARAIAAPKDGPAGIVLDVAHGTKKPQPVPGG